MLLLAQETDPALQKIGEQIAEGVSEGLKEGLKTTSENAPTNWILMITVVALAALGTWALFRFLTTLKEVNRAQDDRDKDHRQHVRDLAEEYYQRDRDTREEWKSHSKDIVAMGKESSSMIASAASDLKATSKENKDIVHDVRNILHEHKGALDLALMQLGKPTINQMINPAPPNTPLKDMGS
jgi:uncharacterized protein YejL (UPF0352 family)